MWTEKVVTDSGSGVVETQFTPQIEWFIKRNPRFAQHHIASAKGIENAIISYKNRGEATPEGIQKIVMKMTRSCNLRCDMCFQWRDTGFHHSLQDNHISFDKMGNLFEYLQKNPCDIIFTGGELMLNPDFPRFVEKICESGSFLYLCTNGTLIDRHYDLLKKYHDQLAFLISLDGPKEVHDSIRGKGMYDKTVNNIKRLVKAKEEEGLQWIIGAENTMMDCNIEIYDKTIQACEEIGIDWMVFNHLWIVSDEAREEWSNYLAPYDVKPNSFDGFDAGPFPEEYVERVVQAVENIKAYPSKMPVFVSPSMDSDEIRRYYAGESAARDSYLKPGVKLDVDINGNVVLTKQFPDLVLGNLYEQSVEEIISSEKYQKVAKELSEKSLRVLNACPDSYNLG